MFGYNLIHIKRTLLTTWYRHMSTGLYCKAFLLVRLYNNLTNFATQVSARPNDHKTKQSQDLTLFEIDANNHGHKVG
jgi:hypothetical protein